MLNSSAALHVFAACSSEDASGWRRTRLENLKRTMRVWALPFQCVGGGEHWRGFGEMAAQYAAAAEGVPVHHHVVMLDSADAFSQGSPDDVLAAFRRVSGGRPIVLGLETGCPKRRSMVEASSWPPVSSWPPAVRGTVALASGRPMGAHSRAWAAVQNVLLLYIPPQERLVHCVSPTGRRLVEPMWPVRRHEWALPGALTRGTPHLTWLLRSRCTAAPPAGGRKLGLAGPAGIPWLSYINGGFVMGEAWAAARLWRTAAVLGCCGPNKKFSAQLGIGRFALASAPIVAFDHGQELVLMLSLTLTLTLTLTQC